MSEWRKGSDPLAVQAMNLLRSAVLAITSFPARSGARYGPFQYIFVDFTVANADKSITIQLDHTPSMWQVVRNQAGGIVRDGSLNGSDWTPTKIVLQASVAGNYGLLIV